jgi:hypothetical protein
VIATQTGSGCAATATAIAKTVYPALSPGSLTSSTTTICVGGTVAAISPTAPSGGNGTYTYQWKQGTGDATGTANTNTFTPSGTYLSTAGTYKFTRTVTSCTTGTTSGTFTLIVIADPTVSVKSAETVCSGATPTAMTATPSGGTGTVSYQWQSGTATSSMSNISSATASTYAPGAITTTTYYRVIATQTGSGCAATATAIAKTVLAFTAGTISGAQTVCVGGTPTAISAGTVASGGDGAITYQWYKNGASIPGATGATATTYTPPIADATAAGVYTYTRRAKSYSCPETTASGSYVLTVVADPTVSVASAESICYNTVPTAMTATSSGGTGTVSYKWYSGTAATTSMNPIDATASTYAPGALTTTTYYRVIAAQTGSGCQSTSTPIAKTVYPQFTAGTFFGTQTVCKGGTPTAISAGTLASGGNGAITYQWYKNGTLITGATATAYTPPVSDATTAGVSTYTRRAKSASCPEATAYGGHELTVLAFCADWTTCSSVTSDRDDYTGETHSGFTEISNVNSEVVGIGMIWEEAYAYCADKGTGWRLPTIYELECICLNKDNPPTLPGGYFTNFPYWSSKLESGNAYCWTVQFGGTFACNHDISYATNPFYIKCVK